MESQRTGVTAIIYLLDAPSDTAYFKYISVMTVPGTTHRGDELARVVKREIRELDGTGRDAASFIAGMPDVRFTILEFMRLVTNDNYEYDSDSDGDSYEPDMYEPESRLLVDKRLRFWRSKWGSFSACDYAYVEIDYHCPFCFEPVFEAREEAHEHSLQCCTARGVEYQPEYFPDTESILWNNRAVGLFMQRCACGALVACGDQEQHEAEPNHAQRLSDHQEWLDSRRRENQSQTIEDYYGNYPRYLDWFGPEKVAKYMTIYMRIYGFEETYTPCYCGGIKPSEGIDGAHEKRHAKYLRNPVVEV